MPRAHLSQEHDARQVQGGRLVLGEGEGRVTLKSLSAMDAGGKWALCVRQSFGDTWFSALIGHMGQSLPSPSEAT